MKTSFVLLGMVCLLSVAASANPVVDLTGTQVLITSTFNGGTSQMLTVTYGAGAEITSSTVGAFSWMSSSDSIDLFFDGRNELRVNFGSSDGFISSDTLDFDVQLLGGAQFGPMALTEAIDVTVPTASLVTASDLSFSLGGLDQIPGNAGHANYTFFGVEGSRLTDPASLDAPEPGTIWLLATGSLGLLGRLRRRNRV